MKTQTRTVWTFVITSVALFMVVLDNLVVSTALPVIRTDLGATIEELEWTVNAYTLTFAVFLLTGAALGDRFGRRRMFIVGLTIFTACLGGGRSRSVDGGADRGPRGAGHRRRDRDAVDADHPLGRVPGGEARGGPRRLVRDCRPGSGGRPARRRGCRRRDRVAVDLLAERPDRDRCAPARAPADREPRTRQGARPARPRARERRPVRSRLGARYTETATAGAARRSSVRSQLVPRSSRPSWPGRRGQLRRCCRFASSGPGLLRGQRCVTRSMYFGMFGSIFLLSQFFQTAQGYSPLEAGLRILPWTAMPMFISPIAGALSDRIGGRPFVGRSAWRLQAIGLAWIAAVSTPTSPTRR